jgi:hypothetical protein
VLAIGFGFLGVGAVFVVVAYLCSVPTRRFLLTAVDATGTVVDLAESSRPEGGGSRFSVIVEFRTAGGATVRWTERTASDPPVGQPGEAVPIKYDPTDPQRARLGTPARLWLLPRLFGTIGAAFFGTGAILVILSVAL